MQRKTLGLICIAIGAIALALGAYSYTLTSALNGSLILNAQETTNIGVELQAGATVKGTLNVTDGTQGVRFYFENPQGDVAYNGGTVYNSLEFSFDTAAAGNYTIKIENLSPTNQQAIEYAINYSAIPQTVSHVAVGIGAVIFGVGLVLAVLKKKASP
jgi:hypothetical protein